MTPNEAARRAAEDPVTNRAMRETLLTAESRQDLVLAAWSLRDKPMSRRKLRELLRKLREPWRFMRRGGTHAEGVSGTPWDSEKWDSFKWGAPPVSVSMIDGSGSVRPVVTTTPDLCDVLAKVPVNGEGLSALGWLHERLPKSIENRHVITFQDRNGDGRNLNRMPAIADLATLSPVEAVLVDGEPMVSGTAHSLTTLQRVRPKPGEQRLLFAGPRSLGGQEVGDVVIRTLASLPRMDMRSPIVGDVARVAALAFGLTDYGPIPDSAGAVFVGGRDTLANRQRWWMACEWLRHMTVTINERTGEWVGLANVDPDGKGGVHLGPPAWWRGKGDGQRWRLSGALWRPVRIGGGRGAGGQAEFHSGLARTLAGFEARLCYAPSAGRGKGGRVPDALRPVRGGPGAAVFIPWRDCLTLAGEAVAPDEPGQSSDGRRYRRRVDALIAAGYAVGPNSEAAPAGDTVEIVKVQTGGKNRGGAGLWIRASARFCEAASGRQTWERIPAKRLLGAAP